MMIVDIVMIGIDDANIAAGLSSNVSNSGQN